MRKLRCLIYVYTIGFINRKWVASYQEALVSIFTTSFEHIISPISTSFSLMYFHILALLWACASVATTDFPVLLTNTTGDVSQSFTLTQLGSVTNTTNPENSTIETYEDVLVNCARPATWDTPSFNALDCSSAIDFLFFETSLTECYSHPCVFYGVNAKTRIPPNGQPTPRKYKFGEFIRKALAYDPTLLANYRSTFSLVVILLRALIRPRKLHDRDPHVERVWARRATGR